ncbi:hypothetical protein AgCh_019937 [Apium graveolens]
MYVEKGMRVDGAKVGTVDEVGARGIFVHITTLVTGSGNLNHRVKERHHGEEKLKMFAIDTLPEKLMEFLVLNLPTTMEGDEHCYSLAVSSPCIAREKLINTKTACSISPFHDEIIHGVRMNIDKFFKNMKPGDLEEAQLNLSRKYCRQKLISLDKGKSQKKRHGSQANLVSEKRPKRKGRVGRC